MPFHWFGPYLMLKMQQRSWQRKLCVKEVLTTLLASYCVFVKSQKNQAKDCKLKHTYVDMALFFSWSLQWFFQQIDFLDGGGDYADKVIEYLYIQISKIQTAWLVCFQPFWDVNHIWWKATGLRRPQICCIGFLLNIYHSPKKATNEFVIPTRKFCYPKFS